MHKDLLRRHEEIEANEDKDIDLESVHYDTDHDCVTAGILNNCIVSLAFFLIMFNINIISLGIYETDCIIAGSKLFLLVILRNFCRSFKIYSLNFKV